MIHNQSKTWNDIYLSGQQHNRAPFDEVVSFVARHAPAKQPHQIKIMEVGCGVGNNLKYLAREGYVCYGIEASQSAVDTAMSGMANRLLGDYQVVNGDFRFLPWDSGLFDLAIDRAALCYGDTHDVQTAIYEIHRTLKIGGRFLFTPFRINTNRNAGDIRCDTAREASRLLPEDKWEIRDFERVDVLTVDNQIKTSQFRIVAEKRA